MTGDDNNNLEFIKKLKALGVKHAKVYSEVNYHYVSDVEFFPPEPERLERVNLDENDNKVNDATGLTRAESRELFGMDE